MSRKVVLADAGKTANCREKQCLHWDRLPSDGFCSIIEGKGFGQDMRILLVLSRLVDAGASW